MTIKKYMKKNPGWTIEGAFFLPFAERDNRREMKKNIKWVLKNSPSFNSLCAVLRSYYASTMDCTDSL